MDNKACRKCGANKPLKDFYFRKDSGNSRSECKECLKGAVKFRMFGVDQEGYQALLERQKDQCGICRIHISEYQRTTKRCAVFSIDHNHSSGAIRGLLCNNCNTAIGLLKEDPVVIMNTLEYLGYSVQDIVSAAG